MCARSAFGFGRATLIGSLSLAYLMTLATLRPDAPGPLLAGIVRKPALVASCWVLSRAFAGAAGLVPSRALTLALALAIAFALPGCAFIPPDTPAPAVAPAAWSAPLPHAGSADALVDWWSRFDDPVLVRLVDAAQQNNPTLEQAALRIAEARANARIAGAALAPALDANVSVSRGRNGAVSFST